MIKYSPQERRAIVVAVVFIGIIRAMVTWSTAAAAPEVEANPVGEPGNGPETVFPLDLNQATIQELRAIPGVAEGLAGLIVKYRRMYGHFASLDDLCRIPGVGRRRMRNLADFVVIGSPGTLNINALSPAPVNLNEAGFQELCRLPGIGPALARAIIRHRKRKGLFRENEDLMDVSGIGEAKFERIRGLTMVRKAGLE